MEQCRADGVLFSAATDPGDIDARLFGRRAVPGHSAAWRTLLGQLLRPDHVGQIYGPGPSFYPAADLLCGERVHCADVLDEEFADGRGAAGLCAHRTCQGLGRTYGDL